MVSDERAEFKRKVNVSSTLSATANLLRIATTVKGAHCEALLGIGHLHHGEGYCLQMAAKRKCYESDRLDRKQSKAGAISVRPAGKKESRNDKLSLLNDYRIRIPTTHHLS